MNKNELKAAQTKKKLCDTFTELLQDNNIEKITINDITSKAGYNRSTFYLYYLDIYDILDQIEEPLLQEIDNLIKVALKNSKEKPIEVSLTVVTKFYLSNEKYVVPLIRRDPNFTEKLKLALRKVVIEFNIADVTPNIQYYVEYQISAVIGVLNLWISNKKDITFNELIEILFSITTNGLIKSAQQILKTPK